jgi:hypothetical protein
LFLERHAKSVHNLEARRLISDSCSHRRSCTRERLRRRYEWRLGCCAGRKPSCRFVDDVAKRTFPAYDVRDLSLGCAGRWMAWFLNEAEIDREHPLSWLILERLFYFPDRAFPEMHTTWKDGVWCDISLTSRASGRWRLG